MSIAKPHIRQREFNVAAAWKSFLVVSFLSLCGCASTLSHRRYEISPEQKHFVQRFEGFSRETKDWPSLACAKEMLAPKDRSRYDDLYFYLFYPLRLGIAPICLIAVRSDARVEVESRLAAQLKLRIFDDRGRPRAGAICTVDGAPVKASAAGTLQVMLPKFGTTVDCASTRFRPFFSNTAHDLSIRYQWDSEDASVRRVMAVADQVELIDPSRIVLMDLAEGPDEQSTTTSEASGILVSRFVPILAKSDFKRVAVVPGFDLDRGPVWTVEVGNAVRREFDRDSDLKGGGMTFVAQPLLEKAMVGINRSQPVLAEIGRLTGADSIFLLSGEDDDEGRVMEGRLFGMDGVSIGVYKLSIAKSR